MAQAGRPPSSRTLPRLDPVHVDPGRVTMFMFENIAILVWFDRPSPEIIERFDRAIANLRGPTENALTLIQLVKTPLQLPDDAARSAILNSMSIHNVAIVAMVVTESGFKLSMLRSVITGLRVVRKGGFEFRIDKSVDDIAQWLPALHAQKTGVSVDGELLLDLMQVADQLPR